MHHFLCLNDVAEGFLNLLHTNVSFLSFSTLTRSSLVEFDRLLSIGKGKREKETQLDIYFFTISFWVFFLVLQLLASFVGFLKSVAES